MKKILPLVLSIILAVSVIVPYSYSGNASKIFFTVSKNEIEAGDTLEMTLNLNKIEYDQCRIALSTDLNVENIYENEDNVELEIIDGELIININKEELSLEQIVLYYVVPEDTEKNIEYTIVATVTNLNNEEEQLASTISVKVVEKEDENEQNEGQQKDNKNQNENNSKNNTNIDGMDKADNNTMKSSKEDMNNTNGESLKTGSISSKRVNTSASTTTMNGTQEVVTYNGSDNNYLSSLEINGYELNKTFNKENTTYFVTVDSSVTNLNIDAISEESTAKVCISGTDNIKTGINKVLISVTSESGAVRIYRIYVTMA